MKIAYIDDESSEHKLMRAKVKSIDIDVYHSVDAYLEHIDKYDLIVSDMLLSGEYGVDVVKKIKKHSNTPVLAISNLFGSKTFGTTIKALLEAGAAETISKEQFYNDPEGFLKALIQEHSKEIK